MSSDTFNHAGFDFIASKRCLTIHPPKSGVRTKPIEIPAQSARELGEFIRRHFPLTIDDRMAGRGLTERQAECFRIVATGIQQTGASPTFQEVADAMNVSKATVYEHIASLKRKGLLSVAHDRGTKQNLILTN